MANLEVKKQERENPQTLIRRFTKKVQQSGVLVWNKKKRFRQKPKSGQLKKRAALRREKLKKEREQLEKLGKLKTR